MYKSQGRNKRNMNNQDTHPPVSKLIVMYHNENYLESVPDKELKRAIGGNYTLTTPGG